jgi:hypothetical protein
MSNSITGQIHFIGQTEQPTATFSKRVIILVDGSNPQFVNYVPLEATQNNVGLLDQLSIGQTVTIDFNIRGNLSKTPDPNTGAPRAFVSLNIWRIISNGVQVSAQQQVQQPQGYMNNNQPAQPQMQQQQFPQPPQFQQQPQYPQQTMQQQPQNNGFPQNNAPQNGFPPVANNSSNPGF